MRKKDRTMKQAIVNGRIIGSATAGRGYVEWDGGVITAVGEGDYQGDAVSYTHLTLPTIDDV